MTGEAEASPSLLSTPVESAPPPRRREPLGHPGPSWVGDGALGAPTLPTAEAVTASLRTSDAPGRMGEIGRTLAPLHIRVAAFVVDEVLLSIFLGIVASFAGIDVQISPDVDFAAALVETQRQMQEIMPLIYAAQVLFRWPWNAIGWSPGKRLLGLRVVDAQGAPPGLVRGLVRSLFTLAGELPLFAGYLWALFDRQRRTWHDHLATTWVVRASREEPNGSPEDSHH